jgi:hypothetical protein
VTKTRMHRLYWVVTILFAVGMLLDGVGGVLRTDAGTQAMQQLGYPVYLLTIVGVAKILGAIAVLQTQFPTLKEWAFAGFVIDCLGAFASRLFAGDGLGPVALTVVFLAITLLAYYLWKRDAAAPAAA